MARPDFSHYFRITPTYVARLVENDQQPTDDMFVKALAEVNPPFLGEREMASLLIEVDPSAERRGRRPKSHRSRKQLAGILRTVSRSDVPKAFIDGLVARLESGKRFTEYERSAKAHKHIEKIKSGMLAAGIYSELRELIRPGMTSVTHRILGTFAINEPDAPLREKALTITNGLLYAIDDIKMISNDRLKNFISEYKTGKLHKKA